MENKHGADLVLGGHDHTYYIGKGAHHWGNYDRPLDELGAEEDDGVRYGIANLD